MSLFDLSGKVAIVTGSTRGIGKAIATRLAEQGARVVVSSRKVDATAEVEAELTAAGYEVFGKPCNIGRKPELQALVDATIEKWGKIDILVCNAAINPHYGPSIELTDEQWDKVMGTNVKSAWWLTNMVLPGMAARNDGAIIVISSIVAFQGDTKIGAYAITKAAEAQLTRNLAAEWGRHNIRVNAIAPGLIKTDFGQKLWENPTLLNDIESRTPLRRIGDPDDVAGMAVCLASDAGRFITGQLIVVDGGMTSAGMTAIF